MMMTMIITGNESIVGVSVGTVTGVLMLVGIIATTILLAFLYIRSYKRKKFVDRMHNDIIMSE